MEEEFYWRNARDSLITPAAINLFQILVKHDGEEFGTEVRNTIDQEYLTITGREEDRRHGGKIQTGIRVFQEAGWVELEPFNTDKERIRITDAGKQANILLGTLPDFLKVVPCFVIELLTRYQ